MPDSIETIKAKADEMRSAYAERDRVFQEVEKIYLLEDDTLPSEDWIKTVISPDPHNALIGAARIMTAADPTWDVPYDPDDEEAAKLSSEVEKLAGAIWRQAGRVRGKPLHYQVALSALLYDEVHIADILTAELVRASAGGRQARAKRIAAQTPLLFDVLPPRCCYAVDDGLGLAAHLTVRRMRVWDVLARWPGAEAQFANVKPGEEVEYSEYWDHEVHAVWTDRVDEPLYYGPHGLAEIPIAYAVVEGSDMWGADHRDAVRQPFLWTTYKSGLYRAANIGMTVLTTMAYLIGANPKMVAYTLDDRDIEIDWSDPGGMIRMRNGEKLEPLAKMVVDPSIREALNLAQTKITESTIYRQVLGEPLGANAPYSMVALLSQAGRQALIPYQRMCSWVIGDAMLKGLRLLKSAKSGVVRVSTRDRDGRPAGALQFDLKTLPDDLELTCTLDVQLPQDERMMVHMAGEASSGSDPLVSRRYARERWLKIGQPDDMQEEIWREQLAGVKVMAKIQEEMQRLQQNMAIQQPNVPPQMQIRPGMNLAQGGMMPPGVPPGVPPGALAQIGAGGGAEAGLPLVGPQDMEPMPGEEGLE